MSCWEQKYLRRWGWCRIKNVFRTKKMFDLAVSTNFSSLGLYTSTKTPTFCPSCSECLHSRPSWPLMPVSCHSLSITPSFCASIWWPPQPQQWRLNDTRAQGDQVVAPCRLQTSQHIPRHHCDLEIAKWSLFGRQLPSYGLLAGPRRAHKEGV